MGLKHKLDSRLRGNDERERGNDERERGNDESAKKIVIPA
jgi:hypothetical protein